MIRMGGACFAAALAGMVVMLAPWNRLRTWLRRARPAHTRGDHRRCAHADRAIELLLLRGAVASIALREPFDADAVRAATILYRKAESYYDGADVDAACAAGRRVPARAAAESVVRARAVLAAQDATARDRAPE